MKRLTIIFLYIFSAHILYAQNKDEQAIKTLLAAQVEQWNRGSVNGYMKGYWYSDSLLFIGSKGPSYGYIPTLERYKHSYSNKALMGALASTVTSMTKLSPDYYFITGTWALSRDAGNISGYYTLLFRKIKGQWVIVVDHSS